MDLHLRDKVIIVTGGGRGIGAAIVKLLADEGATPVIVSRDGSDNNKVISSVNGKAFQITAELTRPDESRRAVAEIVKKFNRIDGLVNNAGENDGVGLENGNYEKFIESLHKNLIHYYLMMQACLPFLRASTGSVVNISSKTAETGQGGTSGYAAANGGRNALTREWAVELLNDGIRVNAVIVSESYTPLYEKWIQTFPHPQQKLEEVTSKIPLGKRMTTPEEIASAVAFLLSDVSSHTTGQLIHVDGGYVHLDRAVS